MEPLREHRYRRQSQVLVGFVALLLLYAISGLQFRTPTDIARLLPFAVGASLTFAAVVWALRAATTAAALLGGIICFWCVAGFAASPWRVTRSGLSPLLMLFLLTFAAGKLGRRRRRAQSAELLAVEAAEERHGRSASQVAANLGVAGLVAAAHLRHPEDVGSVMLLAALAEATADTVSSEMGAAFGGTPVLLTSWRTVPAGTDGAISLVGTLSGAGGAAVVVSVGAVALNVPLGASALALTAAVAGFVFDSLLGATVERRGWLGNDLVNFSSTVVAAAIAAALYAISS